MLNLHEFISINEFTNNYLLSYDKELIIRDFFSFKGEHKIELNSGVNILVGVNGSGKTSFLNAFTLLHEGIAGNGLSALFRQWGTYNAIINACGEQKPDCFSITYVFDADVLKKIVPASPFKNDVYYKITVFPIGDGTSYSLCETLYSEDSRCKKRNSHILNFVMVSDKYLFVKRVVQ